MVKMRGIAGAARPCVWMRMIRFSRTLRPCEPFLGLKVVYAGRSCHHSPKARHDLLSYSSWSAREPSAISAARPSTTITTSLSHRSRTRAAAPCPSMTAGAPSARMDMRAASTTSSLMLLFAGVAMMPVSSMARAAPRRASRAWLSAGLRPALSTLRDAFHDRLDGVVAVADRPQALAFPGHQAEEVGAHVVVVRPARADALEVRVAHAAVLVVVTDHPRPSVALAVQDQALVVAPRREVGIAQAVGHGEQRAVLPAHPGRADQRKPSLPLGKLPAHTRHGDLARAAGR